jgi:hypothetical protein
MAKNKGKYGEGEERTKYRAQPVFPHHNGTVSSRLFWLAVKAVGIALSFGNSLVVTGAARLATQLPGGPVFLGPCNLRML